METKWLIWSIEHGQWWSPCGHGYTPLRSAAGRFTLEEALGIVKDANSGITDDWKPPMEAMVRDK